MLHNNPDTIGEAYRYLANAKETIGRSAIVNDRYSEIQIPPLVGICTIGLDL